MLQKPVQFTIIKKCILDVHQKQLKALDDQMCVVRNLCEAIETVFRLGLDAKVRNRDYYYCLESLIHKLECEKTFIHPHFADAFISVRKSSSLCSPQGKGRQLIRFLLQHGRLDFPIQYLQNHPEFAGRFYNPTESVLAHEILIQIFGSLVAEVCRLKFDLELDNSEFLDETWEMPVFQKYELVPCAKLGARLETMEGHVVVVKVDPGGVAAEDQQCEAGDVLVTMYGQHLRQNAVQIHSLRAQHEGLPVPIGLVKARLPDGSTYRPLLSVLRRHGAEQLLPANPPADNVELSSSSVNQRFFSENPWCRLLYIGQCDVGSDGGVHLINQSIVHVLNRQSTDKGPFPVAMELGELGITVWPIKGNQKQITYGSAPLFKHSFPQISSCGRRTDDTNYLAYIVGDEACTVAKHFRCFVFEAVDHTESKYLISGLAQGFDRTHWTL